MRKKKLILFAFVIVIALQFMLTISNAESDDNTTQEKSNAENSKNNNDAATKENLSLAENNAEETAENSDSHFVIVDDVMIPIPSEIFDILDKLGSPNWNAYIMDNKFKASRGRGQIALQFGIVVAEGFLAVQGNNTKEIKRIGSEVLKLSRLLGVEQEVKEHCQVILTSADEKEWDNIRQEFDRTQRSVQSAMDRLGDEFISQLVSIGGWLRGLNIATDVVINNFSTDKAELIRQQDMASHFIDKLNFYLNDESVNDNLNERGREVLIKTRDKLVEIMHLVANFPDTEQEKTILNINIICKKLIKDIESSEF